MNKIRIFHLATEKRAAPSWGLATLYHHTAMLRAHGYDAFVLHRDPNFRLPFFDIQAPVVVLGSGAGILNAQDLLVVPEILAAAPEVLALPCRKMVFIQNAFYICSQREDAVLNYRTLGYEAVLAGLPHIQKITEKYHGMPAALVLPFVADYFFLPLSQLAQPRLPQILLHAKQQGRDWQIFQSVLRSKLEADASLSHWKIVTLKDRTHKEVAELMRQAAVQVNLNVCEAFNTSVPEAMAAGCLNFCYDAFGSLDFLSSGEHAFVFPNHHIYPLLDQLIEILENYDRHEAKLSLMRRCAFETAGRYRYADTAQSLCAFFESILSQKVLT